jgi:hypothetical protein
MSRPSRTTKITTRTTQIMAPPFPKSLDVSVWAYLLDAGGQPNLHPARTATPFG